MAEMIWIAFFYLLQLGEYSISISDLVPFWMNNMQLFRGDIRLNLQNSPAEVLLTATFSSLTFTIQKNAVQNEVIDQFHSGDP